MGVPYPKIDTFSLLHYTSTFLSLGKHPVYRVIQNKRAKIKQDIGDAPLNNLRSGTWDPWRYGSKLVYHIVYFLFTLATVSCKYSTLTQLAYHFASYNSCSN